MGHTIIKVVQSLQALREQRAADVERASERGQNHTGVPFTLSLSKTPVAGPALARRAARARTPPGPSGSCSSTGRHPTRSRGRGGRRREIGRAGTIVVFPTSTSTTRSFALSSSRLVVSKESKTKERGKSAIGTSGARGWTCPESLPQGWLSRPRRPVGLPLLKLCSSLFRTSPAKKWHHLDFLCPFLLLLKIDRSIRVSTMRYSKKRFLLCRPKNLPCAHQA